MSELKKDLRKLETKHNIAIYEVKWWCPKSDSSNIWKVKTEKGIGFARWCLEKSRYWIRKAR